MSNRTAYNARPWLPICHLDETVISKMQSPVKAKCMALLGITAKRAMECGFVTKPARKAISEAYGKNAYLQLKSVMLELSLGRPFDRVEEDEKREVNIEEVLWNARVMMGILAVLDNPHPELNDMWYAQHLRYKLKYHGKVYIIHLDCLRHSLKIKPEVEQKEMLTRADLDAILTRSGFREMLFDYKIDVFFALYAPEGIIFSKKLPATTSVVVMSDGEWMLEKEKGLTKYFKAFREAWKRWFEIGRLD